MSNSVRPYGQQPTRLLHPQDSLATNTGVGCHFLLQVSVYETKPNKQFTEYPACTLQKHQSHRRQEKSEKPPQTRGCWGDVKTKCNSASWGDPETEEGVREQQVKSEDRVGEGEVTETDWHCSRVVTNTSVTQGAHMEGGDWGVPRELCIVFTALWSIYSYSTIKSLFKEKYST